MTQVVAGSSRRIRKVAAVILSYCRQRDLEECIGSLLNQSFGPIEIVVVDNCPGDGTTFVAGTTRLLRNKENLGWGAGNNVGIREALRLGADYILLLNDDAVLDANCVKNLLRKMELNDRVGIAGPVIYYHSSPKKVWHAGSMLDAITGISRVRGRGEFDVGQYSDDVGLFPSGCCMLISTRVLQSIGLLENRWFMGREEDDICIRAQRAGFRTMIVADAKAWHKVQDRERVEEAYLRYSNALSSLLLVEKHFGKLSAMRAMLMFVLLRKGFQRRTATNPRFPTERFAAYFRACVDYLGLAITQRSKTHQIRPKSQGR